MGQTFCCSKGQVDSKKDRWASNQIQKSTDKTPVAELPETMRTFIDEKEFESASYLGGIYNLGNSCYMSAALQCMIQTPELLRYLMTGKFQAELSNSKHESTRKSKQMLAELIRFIEKLKTNDYAKPSEFKSALDKVTDVVRFCN